MVKPQDFVEKLRDVGVDFFCGVPDLLLKDFCAYVKDHCGGNHSLRNFMIIARCESQIAEKSEEDAIVRCKAYCEVRG